MHAPLFLPPEEEAEGVRRVNNLLFQYESFLFTFWSFSKTTRVYQKYLERVFLKISDLHPRLGFVFVTPYMHTTQRHPQMTLLVPKFKCTFIVVLLLFQFT
jgi:hypothetical protein